MHCSGSTEKRKSSKETFGKDGSTVNSNWGNACVPGRQLKVISYGGSVAKRTRVREWFHWRQFLEDFSYRKEDEQTVNLYY